MENNIEAMAYDVDDFISTMLIKYKTDPLIFSSIILGRLMLANEYVGSDDDFQKLAHNISTRTKTKNKEPMH